jgi:hypothetical protein
MVIPDRDHSARRGGPAPGAGLAVAAAGCFASTDARAIAGVSLRRPVRSSFDNLPGTRTTDTIKRWGGGGVGGVITCGLAVTVYSPPKTANRRELLGSYRGSR